MIKSIFLLPLASLLIAGVLSAPVPEDCKEKWAEQRLDHYRWHKGGQPSFQQRYFVCDKHWSTAADGKRGPIFFYAGNEGPVTGYIKSAGLMFENREAFGALVLFIEHRYYGETQPFGPDSWRVEPSYLTVEQAMSDYTALLHNLTQAWGATDSPIIAFGGSYGGMLAAWMRRRYPHIIAGAVAASAPVGQFPSADFKPSDFWEVVTRDATPAAGAAPDCAGNVRQSFQDLFAAGSSPEGRSRLQLTFKLCDPLTDEQQVLQLAYWAQGAFDAFAMGNYPFASDYMTGEGQGELPAWPMRAACERMSRLAPSSATPSAAATQQQASAAASAAAAHTTAHTQHTLEPTDSTPMQDQLGRKALPGAGAGAGAAKAGTVEEAGLGLQQQDFNLLERLEAAASILYNASGTASCYSLDLSGPAAGSEGPWDYQVCTEFLGQELPYFPTAASSMFWNQGPFNWAAILEHCRTTWGVEPSYDWMTVEHGGLDWRGTSNIVFSNGLLDPWSVFGVLHDVSDSVVAITIPDGAHHLDLMYSRPDDSSTLKEARQKIMQHVQRWLQEPPPSPSRAADHLLGHSGTVSQRQHYQQQQQQ